MRPRGRRFVLIAIVGAVLVAATALTLLGLRDSVVYFYPPSYLAQKARSGERVRIGGLVAAGSVRRDETGALLFSVSDGAANLDVRYVGQPPDLFREGQGVVAEGVWRPGARFEADTLLARHDETYMPREVAEALKARGDWKGAP